MNPHRLKIAIVDNIKQGVDKKLSKKTRELEIQAKMDRMWLLNPEQFDPERDAVERRRIQQLKDLIHNKLRLSNKTVVDIGCGAGSISRFLRDAGAKVYSLDIAHAALQKLQQDDNNHAIVVIQDCFPMTSLPDNLYEAVICTETIGYLAPQEYRLAFSELARIVSSEGVVICSSRLDIASDNALERFVALAETEFEIDQWILHYDKLWIYLCELLEAPVHYARGGIDTEFRRTEIEKKDGLGRIWFKVNSTLALSLLWRIVSMITKPLATFCRQSKTLVDKLEKITKFFWSDSSISHALFIARRRKMVHPLPENKIPREMKHKRQVWE